MERAILVGVEHQDIYNNEDIEASLNELALLADTAGAEVIEKIVQKRQGIDPAFFIGEGKAEFLAERTKQTSANIVIFDEDLSPAQIRNLERVTNVKIIDRSGLILDIFARHAKTKEAKTQVELAQLRYLLPRLTRQWTHLSRQFGGIGTRGPGETQLEVDRRSVRKRIQDLGKALERIEKQRATQRKGRSEMKRGAVVGYTNAGKSTLLNALAGSAVLIEDRLFATLDATTRMIKLPNHRRVLLTDTVGFIKKLPPHLIASFHSTLEETVEADFLIHVVDISHPGWEDQTLIVKEVLSDLGIIAKPIITAWNKTDLIETKGLIIRLQQGDPNSVAISAAEGHGLDRLLDMIQKEVSKDSLVLDLRIPQSHPKLLSYVESTGYVLERRYIDGDILIKVELPEREARKLEEWQTIG